MTKGSISSWPGFYELWYTEAQVADITQSLIIAKNEKSRQPWGPAFLYSSRSDGAGGFGAHEHEQPQPHADAVAWSLISTTSMSKVRAFPARG